MSSSEFANQLRGMVTPDLAVRVRELRVDKELTWRGVSSEIFDYAESASLAEFADMKGDQPLGMYLCEASAAVLGEDANQEPWN